MPIAVYLLSLFMLYARMMRDPFDRVATPGAAVLVVLAMLGPAPVLVIGLVLAGLVAVKVTRRVRSHATEAGAHVEIVHP